MKGGKNNFNNKNNNKMGNYLNGNLDTNKSDNERNCGDKKNNCLMSVKISKQEEIQTLSNNTMCHAFSSAEFLTLRICNENNTINNIYQQYQKLFVNDRSFKPYTPIFGRFDSFDGGKNKPIPDLISQLIFQIENFKDDYNHYIKKYGKYDFPLNLTQQQILKIIFVWNIELKNIEINNGKFSNLGASKYIDNLYNLISGRPIIDYSADIYNFEANNPMRGRVNPKALLKGHMLASHHLENEVLKDPKNRNVALFEENKLANVMDDSVL